MTQKKILLAVAIASTGMIFTTGCARKEDKKVSPSGPTSPVVSQEAARENIMTTGYQIIDQRFSLIGNTTLAASLKALTDAEAKDQEGFKAEVKKTSDALEAARMAAAKEATAENLEAVKAAESVHTANLANQTEASKARAALLVTAQADTNKAHADAIEEAKKAFASRVSVVFDGVKNDKGELTTKPVAMVTPIIVGHEYSSVVIAVEAGVKDMSDEQKLIEAAKSVELTTFESALKNVERFRNRLVRYRTNEINSNSLSKTFEAGKVDELANVYVSRSFESLSASVIENKITFAEMTGLEKSKCEKDGTCGSEENSLKGTNMPAAVSAKIAEILKARQDAPGLKAIEANKELVRQHLLKTEGAKTEGATKESVEAQIVALDGSTISWDILAAGITSISVKNAPVVQENGLLAAQTLKTATQVLTEAGVPHFFQ